MKSSEFQTLGLSEPLLRGIATLGFEAPMPIQERVIPQVLESREDVIALAQTGTGKTAAFGLPLLQRVDPAAHHVQAAVICPTRELCVQITRDFQDYGKFLPAIEIVALYGGAGIGNQIRKLERGPQIVVATPGRLLDLLRRGKVDLSRIDMLVLDEADEMLNMGFSEDLTAIAELTPTNRQTLLFSATMPREVASIAGKYLTSPREITIGTRNAGAAGIRHLSCVVDDRHRYAALRRIIDSQPGLYGIVFCRTRVETQELSSQLSQDGYPADALHGDLTQGQRDAVMESFRHRSLRILAATDVAARGLDIDDLTHILHFRLPDEPEGYIHRSGRTGRAGKSGVSIVLVHPRERFKLRAIEARLGRSFEPIPIPAGPAICHAQIAYQAERLRETTPSAPLAEDLLAVLRENLAGLERDDLLQRFAALTCGRVLQVYQDAPDLNVKTVREKPGSWPDRTDRPDRPKSPAHYDRLIMHLGRHQHLTPTSLIGLVNDASGRRDIGIGKIDIRESFTLFEVDGRWSEQILKNFRGFQANRQPVRVDFARPEGRFPPRGEVARPHRPAERPVNPLERAHISKKKNIRMGV
ncbi:MAG TPA: DEAD/DEAH box helicase [Candidatus Aminicenantes bacterium]|nr:DEAD/DEAH box helicase [Candidatus Aminicenantes bacterium]